MRFNQKKKNKIQFPDLDNERGILMVSILGSVMDNEFEEGRKARYGESGDGVKFILLNC